MHIQIKELSKSRQQILPVILNKFFYKSPQNGVKKMEFPPKARREVALKPYSLMKVY